MLGTIPLVGGGISGGAGGITGGESGPAESANSGDTNNTSGRVNIQTGGGNTASDGISVPVYVWAGGAVLVLMGMLVYLQKARITGGK